MDLDTIILSELQTLKDPVSDSTGPVFCTGPTLFGDEIDVITDFPLSRIRCFWLPLCFHALPKALQEMVPTGRQSIC